MEKAKNHARRTKLEINGKGMNKRSVSDVG